MNGKRFTEEKARRSGFYLALAVCLVAVGVAAWSTYDAVNSYVEPTAEESSLASQQAEDVRESQEAKEEADALTNASSQAESAASQAADPEDTENDDPEAPRTSSSQPAQETAGEVAQQAEPSPESQAPESSQSSESSQAPQVPANAPLYEISAEMIWPVEGGEVLHAYSAGAPVYSQTMKDWRIHTGLDISAQPQAPVMACANGQVQEVYTDSMLGNVALIEHGDYLFYYCGLGEDFQVEAGDVVAMGQQIGVVTAVPYEAAEEPHLHVEVRRDGVAVDPQPLLDNAQ